MTVSRYKNQRRKNYIVEGFKKIKSYVKPYSAGIKKTIKGKTKTLENDSTDDCIVTIPRNKEVK
jgi:hypothetical protein